MKKFQTLSLVALSAMLMMGSCKPKDSDYHTDPEYFAHFANKNLITFYVQNSPNAILKIPMGITTPVATDTKITVSVSSKTGAAPGVQYNLPSNTITIPAGKTTDSLLLQGIFAGFPGNRIDTLLFRITGENVNGAPYNDSLKVVMQKYCTVDINALSGVYNNVMEYNNGSVFWGPYTTNVTPTTPGTYGTKDTLRISNFWDEGNPVDFIIDWTDPSNFKTTMVDGGYVYDNPTYGPAYAKSRGTGTFSSCDQRFVLNWSLYVSAGTFTNAWQTVLAR